MLGGPGGPDAEELLCQMLVDRRPADGLHTYVSSVSVSESIAVRHFLFSGVFFS